MIQLFHELRRRNIFRVAGVYAVVSWLMIQIGVAILPTFEAPPWILKVFILLIATGFPVAMIFAWAFEMTPTGMRPTQAISAEDSIAALTGRKLDYVIILGLLSVAALIIFNGLSLVKPKTSAGAGLPEIASMEALPPAASKQTVAIPKNMIAVLPFANRSTRQEDAYFAEGIHDDLLTQLSKISALQVISRTSVMRFAETELSIPEIAKTLGVSVVLEGAVQRAGNRVRITVQVIDGLTDTHLWAESYNRELTTENIFDIQEEITLAVAAATEAALSNADLAQLKLQPTQSLEAYDAYIKGQLLSRFGVSGAEDYISAIKSFEKAVSHDSKFAAAYAGKAYSELYLYWLYGRDKSRVEVAYKALTKAQSLAPKAIETLIAEAYYNYWGLQDYKLADDTLDRALETSPNNPEVWAIKAYVARRAGRFEQAIQGLEKSHRLDPLKYITAQELADTYSELGYFEKARNMMERAKDINPTSQWARALDANLWWRQGETQKAWNTINVTVPSPDSFYYRQLIFYAMHTRSADNVNFALEAWPTETRHTGSSPLSYNIEKIRALKAIGLDKDAKAEIKNINRHLKTLENPYPLGWSGNAPYLPVTIPGLSGDLRGVNAAIKRYNKLPKTDKWAERDVLYVIALAYLNAGDPDTAFEYVNQLIDNFDIGIYRRLSILPEYDRYREHPSYLDLKSRYEAKYGQL